MDRRIPTSCRHGLLLVALLAMLINTTSCASGWPFRRSPSSAPGAQPTELAVPAATATVQSQITGIALPDLPKQFRYEVSMHPVGTAESVTTIWRGEYRDGDWTRETRRIDANQPAAEADSVPQPTEELIVADGNSYSRPALDSAWTRVPGVGFESAFGLTSPFTVLRMYSLADEQDDKTLEPVPGAPVATFRSQSSLSKSTIRSILDAGVLSLTSDKAELAILSEQVAPLAVSQTITYWVGEDGNIYRAAATLLAEDGTGQPAPWLDITWRFWDYEDATITIVSPADFRDASEPAAAALPEPTTPAAVSTSGENLIVKVFASAGVPAENLAVTIYPAGDETQPLEWRSTADARFTLDDGSYDILVQMDYAQEWIRRVQVSSAGVETREVVFDFGTLELTVTRDGEPVPVEIVTYPAGSRQDWVDWRSDNPATIRLRAGSYDVEIAYDDYTATQTITGLVVVAGETTTHEVTLEP